MSATGDAMPFAMICAEAAERLIGDPRLAGLLFDHGVGGRTKETYEIKEVDGSSSSRTDRERRPGGAGAR